MNVSLSIILSVHNVQTTIVQRVEWLLDMLPDLAVPFEVLIVDDGSTDHTDDLLHELAREFPQIQLAGHRQRQGRLAAVYTGLSMAKGDIVLVDDSQREMSSGELRALWKLQGKKNLVIARAANPQDLKADIQYYRGDNPNIAGGMQLFLRGGIENPVARQRTSAKTPSKPENATISWHVLARRSRKFRRRLDRIAIGK